MNEIKLRRCVSEALEASKQTSEKMHRLLSGFNIDKGLWSEITAHMADTSCLLTNALHEIPNPEVAVEPDWKELCMQEKRDFQRAMRQIDGIIQEQQA